MDNTKETILIDKDQLLGLFHGLEIKDKNQIQELMKLGVLGYNPAINWFSSFHYPVADWNLQKLNKLTGQQLFDLYLRLKK